MPKHVPAEFTGRFSIKPRKTGGKLKTGPADPGHTGTSTSWLPDNLLKESIPFGERKRKASQGHLAPEGRGHSANSSVQDDIDENDDLSVYSQQLQIRSPHCRTSSRFSDLSDERDHPKGIEAFRPQTHVESSPRSDKGLASPSQKARCILSTAWLKSNGNQFDVSPTAHRLAQHISMPSEPDGSEGSLRNAIQGLVEAFAAQPKSLDFLLQIYNEVASLFVHPQHSGLTQEAAASHLEEWVAHYSVRFLERDHSARTEDAVFQNQPRADSDHLKIPNSVDVSIAHTLKLKTARTNHVLAAAFRSRCFSMDLVRLERGRRMAALIEAGLDRYSDIWSQADMIAACIMLRGCGQSLFDLLMEKQMEGIFSKWKMLLESFVSPARDHSFTLKLHSTVSVERFMYNSIVQ